MAYQSDILLPSINSQVITPLSWQSIGVNLAAGAVAAPASAAWTSANRAYYIPFIITEVCTVKNMFWSNGTTPAGNADVGIYLDAGSGPGAKVVTLGATATSGATRTQAGNITDTTLMPGRYYFGVSQSASGDAMQITVAGFDLAAVGVYIEAAAHPLPATATPTTAINLFALPMVGLTLESLV